MIDRVAVTGLGAVSSLGLDVESFWRGLVDGKTALRQHSILAPFGFGELPLGLVPLPADLDEEGRAWQCGRPRATACAELAAAEAMADAAWPASSRLGICVGTTLGEKAPWVSRLRGTDTDDDGAFGAAAPAHVLASRYAARRLRVVSAACASSNAAFQVALDWLRGGLCDAVLCGGVDALQEFVVAGFTSLRALSPLPCRPFDAERSGLNLGEGAAFLLLERESHARARGRSIRAFLDGVGLSCDANHMTGPDREGRGATRAMSAALVDAGRDAAAVDFVSAHGTATLFNDLMESQALGTLLGARVPVVPINSIKGSIGHTLGAAGALEAVMAVRVLEEQLIPPTVGHLQRAENIKLDVVAGDARQVPIDCVLSTSSGFGGLNAAIVLSRGPR